jgi:molecular chaperone DnaK
VNNKIIGIDLGTTNSVVAVMEGNHPTVISDANGLRITPSVVAYTRTGNCLVGRVAKRQTVVNSDNTFYSVKRFIGNTYDSVKQEINQVSYQVIRDSNNFPKMKCPVLGQQLSPENISAQILKKLAADAQRYLGESISQAVISVPAYFNDSQRQATINAGKLANLKVLRIISEPVAAAMAYGLDKKANEIVIVFDLGGGTLDVSILAIGDGVFEVLATCGDTHLGGDDFTKRIVDYIATEFYKAERVNLWQDRQTLQRLIDASEQAKIDLSSQVEVNINLPFINIPGLQPSHLDINLTRYKFNELTSDLLDRCRVVVEQSLRDSRIGRYEIDHVVLAGGSTRIPEIQALLQNLFNKPLNYSVNPDEVVALGAAIQGGVLAGQLKDILLLDVISQSLGVETLGGVMTKIIPRNTTIPTHRKETFSTAVDGQTNVEIHILQGEKELSKDNKSLGTFRLDGIYPAAKGTPQIEVTFDINQNGILNVTAHDQGTGNRVNVTITESNLTKIETLAKESLINTVKSLELNISEVPIARRTEVREHIDNIKEEVSRTSVDLKKVKQNVEELAGITHGTANFVEGVQSLGTAVVGLISFIGTIFSE